MTSNSSRRQSSVFTAVDDAIADIPDELIQQWKSILARDIIEPRVVLVDADKTVEDACDMLLSEDIECLVAVDNAWTGLFDFSDVNAFLTLAATRHTLPPEEINRNERLNLIVEAAKAGRVPVKLVSNFSDKNPFIVLPHDAHVVSLLEVFSRGAHRVFISSSSQGSDTLSEGFQSQQLLGMVSDKRLLSWFATYSKRTSSDELNLPLSTLQQILSRPLYDLAFPLLNIHSAVISSSSVSTVLDAMRLMSEEGVSSVAVVDEESGMLIGAVSVTDIVKMVVPSQSNQILGLPLKQFVSKLKEPYGSTDGVDRYPVYSVFPTSSLMYTMEKLLATNTHRLFITDESEGAFSPSSPGNLTGIISIVDILSLFAHLARIPDVDPTRMQRHRRASSASSRSSSRSTSERDLFQQHLQRSRSNSRTGVRRSPSFGVVASSPILNQSPIAAATSSGSGSALSISGNNSPVGLRPRSPQGSGMVVPVLGVSVLGGLGAIGVGRRGSLNAALRARGFKRDSVS